MKIACSYAGSYGETFEQFVSGVEADLFAGVELIPDQAPNLYDDLDDLRIGRLKEDLRQRRLAVMLHNVFYDINLVSLVPEIQNFAFNVTEKVFRIARELSAKSVTVHPGYMFPGWRSDAQQADRFWASAENAMARLGDLGRQYGIRPLLENGSYHVSTAAGSRRMPLHVGVAAAELARLVKAGNSNIGVCLDFGKMIASERPLREFLDYVGFAIEQIQASHVAGHPDQWSELMDFICARRTDFWVVLEGPLQSRRDQALFVISQWRGS